MKKNHTVAGVAGENPADHSRRQFIKKTAAASVIASAGSILLPKYARAAARPIKIGFVSPLTGNLAAFGAPDKFVLGGIRKKVGSEIMVNGVNHPLVIIEKDSQSDPNRAAQVAAELIKSDKVDLMVTACDVDTVNPVSDQAEINGVPCIVTDCPWQLWFFGRGGDPRKGFKWTYHSFWGFEDDLDVLTDMWGSVPTNKVVGGLWPDDAAGLGYANPERGFPPVIKAKGFKLVDPGRFNLNNPDFSAMIQIFKRENVEIVHAMLLPAAFDDFWSQAAQQGFKPKVACASAGLLFPSAANGLGDRCLGLTTEVNWSPGFPFKSGLTGQTAAQLCAQWEEETGKQWTQPLGHKHALFEVAYDVLKRTKNIDSPESILDAIVTTNYNSIVGHIQWTGNPVKNVCKTPLIGGQWVRGKGKFKYDIVIVNNLEAKEIPIQMAMKSL